MKHPIKHGFLGLLCVLSALPVLATPSNFIDIHGQLLSSSGTPVSGSRAYTVTYYDAGLDQVSYIGMDDTLSSFITRKEIKLDNESTQLTDFTVDDDSISATIISRELTAGPMVQMNLVRIIDAFSALDTFIF